MSSRQLEKLNRGVAVALQPELAVELGVLAACPERLAGAEDTSSEHVRVEEAEGV